MTVNQLLAERGITKYRLCKSSGVPQATINDICSGKTRIEKCSADTLYKISKTLSVTMETLIESAVKGVEDMDHRSDFETFKSHICHHVRDKGDMDFIIDTLQSDEIRTLYRKKWYPEALYLLAMVDYLSRENDIPLCANYNDIRAARLKSPIYPASVIAASIATKNSRFKKEAYAASIPEFLRSNIIEGEVRNVY